MCDSSKHIAIIKLEIKRFGLEIRARKIEIRLLELQDRRCAADKACDVIEVERLGLLAHKDLIELETVESQIDDVDEAIEAAEHDFGLR